MKKIKYIIPLMIAISLLLNSCIDLDDTTFSTESSDTYFNNEEDIKIALVGVYNSLTKRYGGLDSFSEGYIQMTTHGTHTGWFTTDFGRHNYLTGTNPKLAASYLGSYFGISKANTVIQKLEEKSGTDYLIQMTEENRNKYCAEAKFIRALYYSNLAQFFGAVPIVVEPFDGIYNESTELEKSPLEEVYAFIISDLIFAEEHLELRDFAVAKQSGRATKGATQGLLARTYLSMAGAPLNLGAEYYQLAKDQALKIYDSGLGVYELLDDYSSLFYIENETSKEWLFAVQFGPEEDQSGSWGWYQTVMARWKDSGLESRRDGVGRLYPTEELIAAYDPTDPRFINNIITTRANGTPEPNTHKFRTTKFKFKEQYTDRNKTGMNAPILRYADILLILAETENELNGPAAAYQYINAVRERARKGSPDLGIDPSLEPADLVGLNQEEFRKEVFWERARELCWEVTDRLDLVRSGNFVSVLNDATYVSKEGSVKTVTEEHLFFPLPLAAILNNSNLE